MATTVRLTPPPDCAHSPWPATGLVLNFEVEDPYALYALYARLQAAGLPMLVSLLDEPFGQRYFITSYPNGVRIDIIKPMPPTGEYVQQSKASALVLATAK